jgi:hypothetical protein
MKENLLYVFIFYLSISLHYLIHKLTLSNPIFLPTATPQLLFVLGGEEVGGLLVIILHF